jgi:hypothetical protein
VANKDDDGRYPLRASARERMRDAQRREAAALDAVTKASGRVAAEQRRMKQLCAERERSVAGAVTAHCQAVAALAAVSGVERTALLLSEPASAIRRACRVAARAHVATRDQGPALDPIPTS